MEPKHTPGPWKSRKDTWTDFAPHDGHDYCVTIRDADGNAIASTSHEVLEVAIGNAMHIVRCVNAHDALLAACKAALSSLRSGQAYDKWAAPELEAAIAQAEPETEL